MCSVVEERFFGDESGHEAVGEQAVFVVVDVHVEDAGAACLRDERGAGGELRAGDALAGLQERRG